MISALIQIALLAAAATIGGVAIRPTNWAVVLATFVILSMVNEVARRFAVWRAVNKPLEDAKRKAEEARDALARHGGTWGEAARWLTPRLKVAEQHLAKSKLGLVSCNVDGTPVVETIDEHAAARITASDYDPLAAPRFGSG